jgi:hypothetical protein
MEYVSDLMFDTGFDLIMLGDAKKYLEKWRLENKEKTDKMFSLCETRNEERAQEQSQKLVRQDALREEVQNISEILHSQSLANVKKQPPTKVVENHAMETTANNVTQTEDEETAWQSLGASLGGNQKTEPAVEKKKRSYVKKNPKKLPSGQPKNLE